MTSADVSKFDIASSSNNTLEPRKSRPITDKRGGRREPDSTDIMGVTGITDTSSIKP